MDHEFGVDHATGLEQRSYTEGRDVRFFTEIGDAHALKIVYVQLVSIPGY